MTTDTYEPSSHCEIRKSTSEEIFLLPELCVSQDEKQGHWPVLTQTVERSLPGPVLTTTGSISRNPHGRF